METVRLGIIGRRVDWTITNWFRTEAYYRSSEWRATWAGEGGGVLLLDGTPLIAPAQEGIDSLELANAFLLSTLEGRSIQLPIDAALFEERLKKLIGSSTRKKPKVVTEVSDDMSRSFR
jgi:hypothetical protein